MHTHNISQGQGQDNGDTKDGNGDEDVRPVDSIASITNIADGERNKEGQKITLTDCSDTNHSEEVTKNSK